MRTPWFILRSGYAIADHAKAIIITVCALPFVAIVAIGALAFVPPSNLIATPHTVHQSAAASLPLDTTPLDVVTAEALSPLAPPTTYQDVDPGAELCQDTLTNPPAQLLPQLSTSRSTTTGATTTALSVLGYGPGLGALALANELALLDACGPTYAAPYALSPSASPNSYVVHDTTATTTLYEIIVRQGDVLIVASQDTINTTTTTSTTTPLPSLSTLAALVEDSLSADQHTMKSSCVDQLAPLSAAQDNPTQPGFQFPLHQVVLHAPINWALPDQSLLSAPLPTVAPYPVGSVTSAPISPVVPTYTTAVTAEVPTSETSGPGCGWAFDATAVPQPPHASVVAARQAALAPLHAAFDAWGATVSSYLYALAIYQAKKSSYDQWLLVQSSTTTLPTPVTTLPTTTSTTTTIPTTTSTTTTILLATTTTTTAP